MPGRATVNPIALDLSDDGLPPVQALHAQLRQVFAEAIDEGDIDAPSALAALRLFMLDVVNSTARDGMFQQALEAFSADTVAMARALYDENGELREAPDLAALAMLNRQYRH
jgi:hypothetical protein